MSAKLQAVRGMNDMLPEHAIHFYEIHHTIQSILQHYAYQPVVLPIVEKTALFERSVGEVTDIVEKEMYTFEDRNGDSLSLRPEGTAGCVRAGLEHGLFHNQTQKLYYSGPMFRHERPQKGRYRQFYQLGVEAYGIATPDIDAEMLMMQYHLWQVLGIDQHLTLELNTLGSYASRQRYREALVAYFSAHRDTLDDDSHRRLNSNPLRILDSKNPAMRELIDAAPSMSDYLDEASKAHYTEVKRYLRACNVPFVENPHLVRGLDYYCHTVFEWTTKELGAQGTISAGGRYDQLVEQLGGRPCPAIGFALGIERLNLLMETVCPAKTSSKQADVFIVVQDQPALIEAAMQIAQLIRQHTQYRVMLHLGGGSFKSQFKKADKSGAVLALILGEQEWEHRTLSTKYLREQHQFADVMMHALVELLDQQQSIFTLNREA